MYMIIKNARVFTEDGSFMQGDVVVKDGHYFSVLLYLSVKQSLVLM